jgi:RNA polymerase sigma factor (TIGR02999 family)
MQLQAGPSRRGGFVRGRTEITMFDVNDSDRPAGEATVLLNRLRGGDADAGRELLPVLYDELKRIAARQFRGQAAGHTLQPTILVHEAFLRLVGKPAAFEDRAHFFAVAATAMRQILVNHARAANADKRGGGAKPVALNHDVADAPGGGGAEIDVLALHEALEQLARIDPRKHRVIELRFFAGLTVEEIAAAMGLSKTTIESEWRAARAWLNVKLSE